MYAADENNYLKLENLIKKALTESLAKINRYD